MSRESVLIMAWLLVPVMFALVPHALKKNDLLFAGVFLYLGVLGILFFLGNVIMMAGRQ